MVDSNDSGDLLLWELKGNEVIARPLPSRGHAHVVFSVVPMRVDGSLFLTISSDRLIIAYDSHALKPLWTLPCIGGHVAAIATCPTDVGRLAIACGDNLVRIWHTQAPKPYHVDFMWKGIQARVRSVRLNGS